MKLFYRSLFLAILLGLIPLSCDNCLSNSCGCNPPKPPRDFEIKDLGVKTVELETEIEIDTSNFYSADSALKVFFIKEIQVVVAPVKSIGLGLTPQLYACSPKEPSSIHRFTSVQLISNRQFYDYSSQDTVQIGEDISNIFNMSSNYYKSSYIPISEFLNSHPGPINHEEYFLKLKQPPHQPMTFNFDLKVTLSDGREFVFPNEILKVY